MLAACSRGDCAIVKNLSSVETLGSASVICTDRTESLTRSEVTIERVMTASGDTHISGVGYAPEGTVEHSGSELASGPLRDETLVVLSGGSLAGNADLRQAAGGGRRAAGGECCHNGTSAPSDLDIRQVEQDAAVASRFVISAFRIRLLQLTRTTPVSAGEMALAKALVRASGQP